MWEDLYLEIIDLFALSMDWSLREQSVSEPTTTNTPGKESAESMNECNFFSITFNLANNKESKQSLSLYNINSHQ